MNNPLSSSWEGEILTVSLPILTVSEANCSDHWTKKHKRHKKQKGAVFMMLRKHERALRLPCKVTLVRYAPRKLDKHDNLPCSMKYILDAICAVVTKDYRPGRADDSEQIEVVYDQCISKHYSVHIKIELM